MRLKKYFCGDCKSLKSRLQLRRESYHEYTRLVCRQCGSKNIHNTEILLEELFGKHIKKKTKHIYVGDSEVLVDFMVQQNGNQEE